MRHSFARIAVAVCIALPAGNAFGADAQLLNLVMPDAQVMAGMNVTNAEISPLGTFILGQVSGSQALQQLISQTGFDPRKDVTEVLAASTGNPASAGGLLMAKGTFDVDKITARIGAKETVSTYNGATLISGGEDKKAVAFIGSAIVVAGDADSVKAAIDRASGVNSISPALATQVQALSASQDAWSVSIASLGSLIPGAGAPGNGMGQMMQAVKNIQSSSAGIKFGADVQFTAQATADTAQDASALADVIKMVAGLAGMSAASNKDGAPLIQAIQSLKVSVSGATVNISAAMPEAQIEALLTSAAKPHAAEVKKPGKM